MSKQRGLGEFVAHVGSRIQSLRLERGLSVRRLAEIAECSASTICCIELGRSSMVVSTLLKIARALQVEPFDLLNHDPENDDMGYIIEQMRQDPATHKLVKEQLEGWDVMISQSIAP